ncbi:MAG: putative dehydrogenase, partial [Planctomycetota bacterium]
KPFTLNAGEARELADEAHGRLALLDHQLRWSPWRRRMREMFQEGFVGDLWNVRAEMIFGSEGRLNSPYTWWYDRERGGGMLGAIGSHMLDALQFDLGPVDSVRARLSTYRKERPDGHGVPQTVTADEHASLWLRLASGAEATVETNIMAPAETPTVLEYVGSAGTLRLANEETLLAARHGEPLEKVDLGSDAPREEDLGPPDAGIFSRVLPLYLRDVLQAVRSESSTLEHAATFDDGLATMRILDAARASADGATWITCQP